MSKLDDPPIKDQTLRTQPLDLPFEPEQPGHPSAGHALVVIDTKALDRLGETYFLAQSPTRVGRSDDNDIVLPFESVSRRHARFEKRDEVWYVVDEKSTNGTHVGGKPVDREAQLAEGDELRIGTTTLKFLRGAGVAALIYALASKDTMLGVGNRRFLRHALDREIQQSRLAPCDLSVLLVDVDRLRNINQEHGRRAGDFAIWEILRVVRGLVGDGEVLARHSGDELALILPGTSPEGAAARAEAIQQAVSAHRFLHHGEVLPVTVSTGVASLRAQDGDAEDLLHRAAAALDVTKPRRRAAAPLPLEDDLPFPIAILDALIAARRTPLGRVEALTDSIETALRFAFAVALAILREHGGTPPRPAVEALARASNGSGAWGPLVLDLAAALPEGTSAAHAALKALAGATVAGVPLRSTLDHVASIRAAVTGNKGISDDAFAGDDEKLRAVLEAITGSLMPLARLRLVSLAEIVSITPDADSSRARFLLGLHAHRGPGELFPIVREVLPFVPGKGWCHLVGDDVALNLAPIVASHTCDTCGRIEVAIAERLVLGPKSAPAIVRGVTSGHTRRVEVPEPKGAEAIHEAVTAQNRPSVPPPAPSDPAPQTLKVPPRLPPSWPPPPPPPSAARIKILFLGAAPADAAPLALGREVREIKQHLHASEHGARFELAEEWAVRPQDLHAALLKHKPQIVHVSGHGRAPVPSENDGGGILVEDDRGAGVPIAAADLAELFKIIGNIRVVFLNACYSAAQAEVVSQHVQAVVGWRRAVSDRAATAFAWAFYEGLGFGRSLQDAVELGRSQIRLQKLDNPDAPRLLVREGAAAGFFILAGEAPGSWKR